MNRPRASQLGWLPPASLASGSLNALADVPGVVVGHTTLIQGEPGPLIPGKGPVRTGITTNRFSPDGSEQTRPVMHWVDKGVVFSHLFQAVVEAVEEAVLNALAAAATMLGRDRHLAPGIPVDIIRELLRA